jgi:IclR family KDG regulon transcriptional repressor
MRPDRSNARDASPNAEIYRIQVIDRATQILDCFGFDDRELSLQDISRRTGLHKSTAHRILIALRHNGLIQQNSATGCYHLGIKLFKLGQQAVSRLNLRDIARPFLEKLMEATKETVHLATLDEDQVFYLDKVEGPHALRMPSRVGRHIPPHCTSLGKAMLSCLTDVEVKRMVGHGPLTIYTPNTIGSVDDLIAELGMTRRRGYSVDNEEIEVGLRCIGAPVRDYTGRMVGGISVAGPSARVTAGRVAFFAKLVKGSAESISSAMGFQKRAAKTDEKEDNLGWAR